MFALGARYIDEEALSRRHMELGANLTRTCYGGYQATATGLAPEVLVVNLVGEYQAARGPGMRQYMLRPEVCRVSGWKARAAM
jgi:hypothetical protein